MYWKEIFILAYFIGIVFFDGKIIVFNNIFENIVPMLLINPISFLYTKYAPDSIFGLDFAYFNMIMITAMLLVSNLTDNNIPYNQYKKICLKADNIYYAMSRPLIIISIIFGIWYIYMYNWERTFGLALVVLLLKFKIYIMMTDIDECIHKYINNINCTPVDNVLQSVNNIPHNIYNMNSNVTQDHIQNDNTYFEFNITVYETISYVHKLCILKFWIFLGLLYAHYKIPSNIMLYALTITHSLYILSVLKLHYLLNNNTHPKLNVSIMISDIFFSNLTYK